MSDHSFKEGRSGWGWANYDNGGPAGHVLYTDLELLRLIASKRFARIRALDPAGAKHQIDAMLKQLALDPASYTRLRSQDTGNMEVLGRLEYTPLGDALALFLANDSMIQTTIPKLLQRLRHQDLNDLAFPGLPLCLVGKVRQPATPTNWAELQISGSASKAVVTVLLEKKCDLVWSRRLFSHNIYCVGILRDINPSRPSMALGALVM